MQPEVTSAFVLHARPFKENLALLEVLMAGEGRISLITFKGGKKNSGKSALLQPFRPIAIQIKKESGLRKLQAIEEDKGLPLAAVAIQGRALYSGFYLNEIICRLCPADAYFPDLYPCYAQALRQLAGLSMTSTSFELNLQLILRRFEYRLLVLLGYGIDLEHEAESGAPIEAQCHYLLFPETGFVAALPSKSSLSGEQVQRVVDILMCDRVYTDCGDAALIDAKSTLAAAKFIFRACLHRHLGDKPLKSRELFRTR